MTWRCVDGYAVGTSHLVTQTACQDRCRSEVFAAGDGGEVLLCIVSDGAGSAGHAEQGAELVCAVLTDCVRDAVKVSSDLDLISDELVRSWFLSVREKARSKARDDDGVVRDYSATALLVVASAQQTLCAQIGDGAIVLREKPDSKFRIAIWPETAEYANETFFVTDPSAPEHVQIARYDAVSDVIVFSDGLQRLALEQASRTAHGRFFDPLVNTVRETDDLTSLHNDLIAYLSSSAVNGRTDDDKSLAIACRLNDN